MPNLTEIEDSDAVDSIYAARAVVYVEAEEDSEVFARLVGMHAAQKVDFKAPRSGHSGWEAVCDQVERERQSGNLDVFGLIDGDAAACLGRWRDLIDAEGVIFDLCRSRGMLCLADHELENLLLRFGGICAYLADDVALNKLSSRAQADIEETLRRLTRRFFHAAVLRYAVQHLHHSGRRYPAVTVGRLQDSSVRTGAIRTDLKERTDRAGLDWGDFLAQVYEIKGALRGRFRKESMSTALRSVHLLRLADGKELMKKMISCYKASTKTHGHLVQTLVGSEYASEFRSQILHALVKETC